MLHARACVADTPIRARTACWSREIEATPIGDREISVRSRFDFEHLLLVLQRKEQQSKHYSRKTHKL